MISAVSWNRNYKDNLEGVFAKKMSNEVEKNAVDFNSLWNDCATRYSYYFSLFLPTNSCNKKSKWNSIWLNFLTTDLGSHSRLSFSNSKKLEGDS